MKAQLLLSLALALVGFNASAHELEAKSFNGPLYDCQLAGNVSGQSIAIGVGGQRLIGDGMISCRHNITGDVTHMPVKIKLEGIGVGLEVSQVQSVRILSAGVGINDPRLFFKSYSVGATAGVSLIRLGIGADVALRVNSHDGLGFEVGLIGKEVLGLGAHLYAMKLKIVPVGSRL